MSSQAEINRMILRRIEASDVEQMVKDFVVEVLNFEYNKANQEIVRFKDDYLKMIQKYSQDVGEEDHV
jgi:hypothetical protein